MRPVTRTVLLAWFAAVVFTVPALAQAERLVVLKIDGLPPRMLAQQDRLNPKLPRLNPKLPWIARVFGENGTRLDNFYVRGLSLSAPSWSLLDTGLPLEIRGNVEYDRYTLRPLDYLNFVPFYFSASTGGRVDMRGVELLDELKIPLLLDRFAPSERYQSFQLLQRGVEWDTLKASLKRLVAKAPRDFLDEWIVGLSIGDSIVKQAEHDMLEALKNPEIRYLDYFAGDFDHVAHLTNDPVSQFHKIEELDALVGRVWTAIQASPLADSTALILVSDHGMSTSSDVFSQGYNLVDWFNSASGGAHHVLTNRHPLSEFKVRGLDPFVSAVITPSAESAYLKDQGDEYPSVMLDLDGNERASIGLRNNTFNIVHILLQQIARKGLPPETRAAAIRGLIETLDQVRAEWSDDLDRLDTELAQLRQYVDAQPPAPKRKRKQPLEERRADTRRDRQLDLFRDDVDSYAEYAAILRRLLALTPNDFDPGRSKLNHLVPEHSLGPLNSVWDLQHYVTGPAPNGLALTPDGNLDWERSFTRINYLDALHSIRVRNNVQEQVGPRPVDFVALDTAEGTWLYQDEEHQALIQTRDGGIRYTPIAHLTADRDGTPHYEPRELGPGFPLAYFEDPNLAVSPEWLTAWHTEQEWFAAVHRTRYSNGIVGIVEQMRESSRGNAFDRHKRHLRRTDLLVFAAEHWNFNARGFNPGGNHGSFLRDSTHSVLMFSGGPKTGIPHGVHIETPYDSLSFLPTVLSLMGRPDPTLPGPVIKELTPR
jgi:hypothetical protein